jgi:hypothetical protein
MGDKVVDTAPAPSVGDDRMPGRNGAYGSKHPSLQRPPLLTVDRLRLIQHFEEDLVRVELSEPGGQ